MKKPILLLLLLVAIEAKSQSIFEDASGEALLLEDNGLKNWFNFRLNTSADAFTFSFLGTRDLANKIVNTTEKISRTQMLGVDLKLKIKDGLGNILTKGELNPGVTFGFVFGVQKENFDLENNIYSRPRSYYLKAGFTYEKHTLLDTLAIKGTEVKKIYPYLTAHFNQLFRSKTAMGNLVFSLFGISVGYKESNNLEDLDDGLGSQILKSSSTYNIIKNMEGKIGDLKRYYTFPLRVDYGVMPNLFKKNMIGFNTYARANFNQPKTPVNLGTGIFFSKKNDPTNVVGGVGWQMNDIFNKPDVMKNSSVFVYVGYTIN